MRKFRIYWNLHKKVWSLQSCKTGRVVNHVSAFTLIDCKFVVRPAGQAKDTGEPVTEAHVISVFTKDGRPSVYARMT